MGDDTVKAIERRWSTTHDRGAHDYTDEGCRILAEGAFKDVRILLSALVAAEAERDRLQHFVDCADTPLMRDVMAARDKAEAERDKALARVKAIEGYLMEPPEQLRERAEAAEAERDEANRLLREVVKADRQDAQMGYPIPGDSCMGAFIGLVLMEYLDGLAPSATGGDDE